MVQRAGVEGRVPAYYTDTARTNVYRSGDQTNLQNDWVKLNAGYRLPTKRVGEGGAGRSEWTSVSVERSDKISFHWANYRSDDESYDMSPPDMIRPLALCLATR
jgi:hypothetical protein